MGYRGDCAIELYRTPTTLGHSTNPGRQQLYHLTHRNKHREAAKMRRQRYMVQMKKQDKTSEKELIKLKTNNLLDAEFKTLHL